MMTEGLTDRQSNDEPCVTVSLNQLHHLSDNLQQPSDTLPLLCPISSVTDSCLARPNKGRAGFADQRRGTKKPSQCLDKVAFQFSFKHL